MVRLVFRVAICVLPIGSVGCFPFAYPESDRTPTLPIDAPVDEVQAYRVDSIKKLGPGIVDGPLEELTPIDLTGLETTPPLSNASVKYGLYWFPGWLDHVWGRRNTVSLRLYRPGYELVEIDSDKDLKQIEWIPADLRTQEQALDRAFSDFSMKSGVASEGHKRALLYGASEYKRLARSAPIKSENCRLGSKAWRLEYLANDTKSKTSVPDRWQHMHRGFMDAETEYEPHLNEGSATGTWIPSGVQREYSETSNEIGPSSFAERRPASIECHFKKP